MSQENSTEKAETKLSLETSIKSLEKDIEENERKIRKLKKNKSSKYIIVGSPIPGAIIGGIVGFILGGPIGAAGGAATGSFAGACIILGVYALYRSIINSKIKSKIGRLENEIEDNKKQITEQNSKVEKIEIRNDQKINLIYKKLSDKRSNKNHNKSISEDEDSVSNSNQSDSNPEDEYNQYKNYTNKQENERIGECNKSRPKK